MTSTPKQYAAIVEDVGSRDVERPRERSVTRRVQRRARRSPGDRLQRRRVRVPAARAVSPIWTRSNASADALNKANEIARSRGVSLGYHNHWWEFSTILDGQTAWSTLIERLDPTVFAEVDIYWATLGGADPRQVIADLGDRLWLLHVKDGPCDAPESPMVAVGSGTLDIPAILASAPTAKWHIVELDRCATDMFTALADSYRYLVDNGLSQGRK